MKNEKITEDKELAKLADNMISPINCIEFFDEDEDTKYCNFFMDQLTNLPSMIMSKYNIEPYSKGYIFDFNEIDLKRINYISKLNTVELLKNMLYSSISSNLGKFYHSVNILLAFDIRPSFDFWIDIDMQNEQFSKISIDTILKMGLFDQNDNPIHSVLKDNERGINNTNAVITATANQLYIYLCNIISYSINYKIDLEFKIHFRNEQMRKLKDFTDGSILFIKNNYTAEYESMKQMFEVVNNRDAIILFTKHITSVAFYEWCENVLHYIIHNTLEEVFKTNYNIYADTIGLNKLETKEDKN